MKNVLFTATVLSVCTLSLCAFSKTDAIALPGWENEVIGFRSYGPFVLDLFGKHDNRPKLTLRRFYDAKTLAAKRNYHSDSKLGMDILHIGDTAGFAGIAVGDREQMLLASEGSFDVNVISTGPHTAVVEFTKAPWTNEFGIFKITRRAEIQDGWTYSKISDSLEVISITKPCKWGVGMKIMTPMGRFDDTKRTLYLQWHGEDEEIGTVGLGLWLGGIAVNVIETEKNRFFLYNETLAEGRTYHTQFYAFGAWGKNEATRNLSAFQEQVDAAITTIQKLQ